MVLKRLGLLSFSAAQISRIVCLRLAGNFRSNIAEDYHLEICGNTTLIT